MRKKKGASKKKPNILYAYRSLLTILFGLIGIILLYLFFAYPRQNFTQTFVDNTSQEAQTLEGLARFLETKVTPQDFTYDDWTENNGIRVPLKSKQILLGTSTTSDNIGKYGDFTTDELENVNDEFLADIQKKISEYFESNGFTLNETNTTIVPNDLYFSTQGFEKDSMYCLAHLAKQSDPFGYISCGVVDSDQLSLQRSLRQVRESQQSDDFGNVPLTFRVSALDGNFANGSISGLGGYQWIAKKTDGVWTTIWTGQEAPMCSDMKQHEVPQSMYPGCYNESSQQIQDHY